MRSALDRFYQHDTVEPDSKIFGNYVAVSLH